MVILSLLMLMFLLNLILNVGRISLFILIIFLVIVCGVCVGGIFPFGKIIGLLSSLAFILSPCWRITIIYVQNFMLHQLPHGHKSNGCIFYAFKGCLELGTLVHILSLFLIFSSLLFSQWLFRKEFCTVL